MATLLPNVAILMTCAVLLHAVHTVKRAEGWNFSGAEHDDLQADQPGPFRVVAVSVSFDISPSAHECKHGSSFFSAKAIIKVATTRLFIHKILSMRQKNSFILALQPENGIQQNLLTFNNVNVTDVTFRHERAFYSFNFEYEGEIGMYPNVGLVRTSCFEGRWPKQSPIVTNYGNDDPNLSATSIFPTVLSNKNAYMLTVSFKRSGMQQVVFSPYPRPSSRSAKSENVIEMTYKTVLPTHKIIFAIAEFNYEASSAFGDTSIRVRVLSKTAMPRFTGFVMNEAREMVSAMEEHFGRSLVDTDLYFIMVPGTITFQVDPFFAVLGTEIPSYNKLLFLWKLVRETVVMIWIQPATANTNEKMIVDGTISHLVESLISETKQSSRGWVSSVLSEKLRNALPLEFDESLPFEGIKTPFNAVSRGHFIEMTNSLIGTNIVNEALNISLQDFRQARNVSLLKTLDQLFLQKEQKDWCGRPFNVTDFFIRWVENAWPKSGVSVTKLLLHVKVDDRGKFSIANSAQAGDLDGRIDNYPPIPILIRSLNDSEESVIWQSQECGVVSSREEEYVMALIRKSDVILRVGSPSLHRITYEESGPLGYPTLLSKVYSQKTKVSTEEQLVFVADRLHFLL